MPFQIPISKDLRKLLAFGSGVGIEIGATDLEVAAVRVRPTRIRVLGRVTIRNFAGRPAAEWGAEYARFLKSLGAGHMSATVLLPRREAIVRQLALPGVARKDMEGAIRFQLDSLHPYGEDEVSWGWSRLAYGAVLVGIVRRATVEQYVQLFTEAGVAVCSFTFSAAAVHAAIRLNGAGPNGRPRGWIRRLEPVRIGRRGGVRGKRRAPGFLGGIRIGPGTRRGAGAGRVASASRNRPLHARGSASQAGRQSGGERSFPQRTAVRNGAGWGLSPARAGGERAPPGAPAPQFPRGLHPHAGSGGAGAAGGRRCDGLTRNSRNGSTCAGSMPKLPNWNQWRGARRRSTAKSRACARALNCSIDCATRRAAIWTS